MHIMLLHFYSQQPNPVYQQIAAALRQRGHCVWLGSPDEEFNLVWEDGEQRVATLIGPFVKHKRSILPNVVRKQMARLMFMMRIRKFLRQQQPDVVQINPAALHWVWLLPLAMPSAISFVLDWRQISQHHTKQGKGVRKANFVDAWRRFYARFYDHVCFLHAAGAEKLLGTGWQRNGRVVPLAVDHEFLIIPTPACPSMHDRNQPADDERPVRFLYIGSLSRVRRLERLIEAAALLAKQRLCFQLHLVGPDRSEGYYQQLIVQHDLTKQVAILPAVPYAQVPATVLGYDVALAYVPEYPADWQYHPTVKVLEYRALGIPIIASDFAPNREVVEADVNGLLVANTPEHLAAGMERFLRDKSFLTRCCINARQMRTGVTWLDVAQRYEALYCR